jgi:Flp pilus assembly pilin Flp
MRTQYRIWHNGSSESGQALVEYALIIALVSLVAIVLLSVMGTDISGLLAKVTVAMESAV